MNAPFVTAYLEHGLNSLVHQIFLSDGEFRMICRDRNAFFRPQREMEGIVETNLLKNGSQLVVPILPSSQDLKSQVDLCRRL
jgi:hypothetical protein